MEENIQIDKCKTIMVEHEKINNILNNVTISNLYKYDFSKINKFSVIHRYQTVNIIVKVVIKLINKLKKMIYPILIEYNRLIELFDIKENKIIINRFNINYFYKLILNILNACKFLKKTMRDICEYTKNKFIINEAKFNKFKDKIINIHLFIQIYLRDLSFKLEDIY